MFLIRLSDNHVELKRSFAAFDPVFGDWFTPEDAMGALLRAALDPKVGWREEIVDKYYRVVILVTDAKYRIPGDNPSHCGRTLKDNDGNGDYDHRREVSIG